MFSVFLWAIRPEPFSVWPEGHKLETTTRLTPHMVAWCHWGAGTRPPALERTGSPGRLKALERDDTQPLAWAVMMMHTSVVEADCSTLFDVPEVQGMITEVQKKWENVKFCIISCHSLSHNLLKQIQTQTLQTLAFLTENMFFLLYINVISCVGLTQKLMTVTWENSNTVL